MYLGISFALLVGSGHLGARLLGLKGFWERQLGAVLITLAEMVLLSLVVGSAAGGYRPLPLTIATGVLFLVLLEFAWRTGRLRFQPVPTEERPYVWAYAAVVGLTLPLWAWVFASGLLLPPVYWDELYYHLVIPAVWVRDGQIHNIATGNPFVAGYPANFSLVTGWTMVMTGTDVWSDLLGLPFVFVGLSAVIAFCRELKIRPGHSFWAGLLFVTTPMVISHAKSAYIDLPIAVTFSIALYFLFRYANDGLPAQLFLGAVAMGLLVGAKYSGPYMAIAGFVPVAWYMTRRRLLQARWRDVLALYGLPILLLGGYWYVRNAMAFHSPVYPMKLDILTSPVFVGRFRPDAFTFTWPENVWLTLGKALLETEPAPRMDSYYAGLGPQLLVLAIPSTVLFWVQKREWRSRIGWLLLMPVALAVLSLPAKYPRYLIYLSLMLLPFGAWLLDTLPRWPGRLVKAMALSFAVYSAVVATPIYFVRPDEYNRAARDVWSTLDVGVGHFYGVIKELNDAKGGPLRIAAHGNLRLPYPLMGQKWQNDLLYIPATTEDKWLAGVLAVRSDVLAIDTTEALWAAESGENERKWIAHHPEVFQLIAENDIVQVYLVIPGDEAHQALVDAGPFRR